MQLNFTPFPTITTERLVLRTIEMSDAEDFFALRSDDEVNKYVGNPKPKSIEDICRLIEKLQNNAATNEAIFWVICTKENPTLIGTACFWNISKENETIEVGYTLLPHVQGKGYMHEAMKSLTDYGFGTIQAKSIEAFTHKDNMPSLRLLSKNGFQRNILLEKKHAGNEDLKDMVIYVLGNPNHKI